MFCAIAPFIVTQQVAQILHPNRWITCATYLLVSYLFSFSLSLPRLCQNSLCISVKALPWGGIKSVCLEKHETLPKRECKLCVSKIQIWPHNFAVVFITCLWLNSNLSLHSMKIRQTFPPHRPGLGQACWKSLPDQPESGRIKMSGIRVTTGWNRCVGRGVDASCFSRDSYLSRKTVSPVSPSLSLSPPHLLCRVVSPPEKCSTRGQRSATDLLHMLHKLLLLVRRTYIIIQIKPDN